MSYMVLGMYAAAFRPNVEPPDGLVAPPHVRFKRTADRSLLSGRWRGRMAQSPTCANPPPDGLARRARHVLSLRDVIDTGNGHIGQ